MSSQAQANGRPPAAHGWLEHHRRGSSGNPMPDPTSGPGSGHSWSTVSDLPSRRRTCRRAIRLPPRFYPRRLRAGSASPVRAGAFDPDHIDLAVRPSHRPDVGSRPWTCERFDAKHPADVIDHGGHVNSAWVSTPAVTGHVVSTMVIAIPSCSTGFKGWHALAGKVPGAGLLAQTRNPFPTRPVGAVSGPADGSFAGQRRRQPIRESDRPRDGTDRRHTHHSRRGIPRPEHPQSSLCRIRARRVDHLAGTATSLTASTILSNGVVIVAPAGC